MILCGEQNLTFDSEQIISNGQILSHVNLKYSLNFCAFNCLICSNQLSFFAKKANLDETEMYATATVHYAS